MQKYFAQFTPGMDFCNIFAQVDVREFQGVPWGSNEVEGYAWGSLWVREDVDGVPGVMWGCL